LNNRSIAGLSAASSLTNNMRSSDIQEQIGLNNAAQSQIKGAADISGQMRTQDYNEKSYLDKRTLDALQQQTDLTSKMRDQLATESIANQSAKQAGLNTLASTSTNARNSSAQESQYRATAADDFTVKNNAAINKAKSDNTGFLQDAYQATQNNRTQTYLGQLDLKTAQAQGLVTGDRADAAAGWEQAQKLGFTDAATWNALSQEQRNQIIAIFQGGQAAQADATHAGNAAGAQVGGAAVGAGGTAIGAALGGAFAGSTAGGATAAQGATAGAQVGQQALTNGSLLSDEEKKRRGTFSGSL
jgi:hypothetical protein